MHLTTEERAMLEGAEGQIVRQAMQIVATLGEIYDAARLVAVGSTQIAGVSYKNLGEAGLQFLEEWASRGTRVRVPAFANPAGMDLQRWREMGIPAEFASQQQRVVKALTSMGVLLTCTCTPYLVGHAPRAGEHLAWGESSAVSYANSVLAARTNREGGPSALAAAVTGRTAAYGLHLTERRRPTHCIEVSCPLVDEADYGALGYMVGRAVSDGIPYFRLLAASPRELPTPAARKRQRLMAGDFGGSPRCDGSSIWPPTQEQLMALGAAMAASGAVALFHIEGATPEAARWAGVACSSGPELIGIAIDSLEQGYEALNSPLDEIDFVSLGCPHSTLEDLQRTAALLDGRKVKATLWITTSRGVREAAELQGLTARIESAGGRVFADTCLVVAPVEDLGFKAMATNSAKAAFYAPGHSGLQRRFGSLQQCIQAAIDGRWGGPVAWGPK
jgi:predicted aconitase